LRDSSVNAPAFRQALSPLSWRSGLFAELQQRRDQSHLAFAWTPIYFSRRFCHRDHCSTAVHATAQICNRR